MDPAAGRVLCSCWEGKREGEKDFRTPAECDWGDAEARTPVAPAAPIPYPRASQPASSEAMQCVLADLRCINVGYQYYLPSHERSAGINWPAYDHACPGSDQVTDSMALVAERSTLPINVGTIHVCTWLPAWSAHRTDVDL